jgi:hypothetical protein
MQAHLDADGGGNGGAMPCIDARISAQLSGKLLWCGPGGMQVPPKLVTQAQAAA